MSASMAPSNSTFNESNSSNSIKMIEHYKIGTEIGRGSFANVYKGVDLKNNQPIAIKSVVRSLLKNKKLLENLEIEISILKQLKHPHIVQLLDYKQTEYHFNLIMEYCSLGDLSYFIRKKNELISKHPLIKTMFNKYPSPKNSNGLNKILVLNYLKQLSSALKFLRSKNLVHRDIKPQNLLLSPPIFQQNLFDEKNYIGLPELPILSIADFGFARFLPNTSLAETLCGSPLYMAPEILNYQKYTAKADLWSVGAVLFEMSVGKPPFRAENHLELFNKIKKSKDRIHFPSINSIDPQIKRLICDLLKFEPTERMGFNEFFNDEVVNYDLNLLKDGINESINLESCKINENLFISEYISKGEIIDNNIQQDELIEEEEEEEKTSTKLIPKIKQISKRDIQPIQNQLAHSNSTFKIQEPQQIITNRQLSDLKNRYKFKNIKNSSEIQVEKEYVVVEKTAVEVNALADELANAGTGVGAIALPTNHNLIYTQQRRRSSRGSSSGGSSNGRRPSFDTRRVSISISPTNALSKALGLASTRLFGTSNNSSSPATSPDHISTINNSNNTFTNNIILNSTNHIINYNSFKVNTNDSDDIVVRLESLATKAHVINLFAEVKFSQLIPSPPSLNSFAVEDEDDDIEDGSNNSIGEELNLLPETIKQLADEAVLLYVKTLSLLAKAMNVASEWWHDDNNKPSIRLNEIVQWIRERFNEVLEKAEFVKLKLEESKKRLNNSSNVEEKIYAEKLIYDRAIEIAKNTAKTEMTGNDLLGCELAYSTSIWMLEALLDQDSDFEKFDSQDKELIERYIESISNRLGLLKKRLEGN
ncbi:hypothetical protein WICMUC_003322 [Wickerhamomyces mucosus]|uniref:Serine/threonine-protein kinase ATG1 n=1 Tax=Wickerhamomyces mucosus TaxID=1378264 RepID=A0A9P8PN71_9ASCO|nr:hypothetical protein WICMUC_003322 [Wickerhamomyces mucosus]